MTSKWTAGLIALSCLAAHSQAHAKHTDIRSICVSLDQQTEQQALKVEAMTRCLGSGARTADNTLALSVDQNSATIQLTGDLEVTYSSRVGSADCMGSRTLAFEAADTQPRRYSVVFGDQFLGFADFTSDVGARHCFDAGQHLPPALSARQFSDWTSGGAPDWESWRADSPAQLVAQLMAGFPETLEGRPEVSLTMEKTFWQPSIVPKPGPIRTQRTEVIAIRLTMLGLPDDAVAGQRFIALAAQGADGWFVKQMFSQSMCSRGTAAGQWQAGLCP
ncbi:hypothetical protein ACFCW2_09000 [Qipengyuania sp. DSG2-2]|uniref:hypothetical protein n=1 Tax=Qipengyuania sp. DGS2-2 TaxID=3349631 RepID=UPI0036D245DD